MAWPNAVGHDRKWVDGTVDRNANQKGAFGLRFYAMPLEKVTYQFAATGKTRIVYTGLGVHTFDPKAQEDPIQWLSDINSISSDDIETQEMPYTEEAALFFIGLYKWLFAVNENIKPYLNPKGIAQLATLGRGLFITEGDKAQAGEKGKTE